jgi:formiminoglutamate deiminase
VGNATTAIFAERALLAGGWAGDVRLEIEAGRFVSVETGAKAEVGDERCAVLLPAIANVHSHAFQRGMAGLSERRGPTADSFWSWRDLMYRFALSIRPDQVEAIAAQLYVEMLESGFCRVGEFHYLHHDVDGRAYANIAEMGERIAAAADATGIGLTLLPVFYAHATFGGAAPSEQQRRFINSLDGFTALLDGCKHAVSRVDGADWGVAPHSLRATTGEEIAALVKMSGGKPIHIHIAEQTREVDDCVAFCGARPVEWLLANAPVDVRWCLIHATHMTAVETVAVAKRGAVVGLCPVTEANLGDGIFNGATYLAASGRFGVGSDSNVLVGLSEELRQFEYSQRLANRARNVIAASGQSTGRTLFEAALRGGAQALGVADAGLLVGASADCFSVDMSGPSLCARRDDEVLDSLVFASSRTPVDCAWVRGRRLVQGGRHAQREAIARGFQKVMGELRAV